jgi:hypothetical protein
VPVVLVLGAWHAFAIGVLGLPSVNVSRGEITVSWITDESGTTEVHFGQATATTALAYPNHSVHAQRAGTTHSRTLRNLPPGTYFYRVRSFDGAAAGESAEATFVVPGVGDVGFAGELVFDDAVSTLARHGGKLLVGGRFTRVGSLHGSGVLVDDSVGSLHDGQPLVRGQVKVSIPDGAGGFYIGGAFSEVGGLTRNNAAHILPDFGVDPDWNLDVDGPVEAMALSGSRLYVGGSFSSVKGGTARANFAAFDAAAATVQAFAPDFDGPVYAIAVSGSVVYVGGAFVSVNSWTSPRLAALSTTTGDPLFPWNPNPNGVVRSLAASLSTLYVGGTFSFIQGEVRNHAAALALPDAAVLSWNPNLDGPASVVVVDGTRVFIGGAFNLVKGSTVRHNLAAFDVTVGAVDAWNPNVDGAVRALSIDGGLAYVGGAFTRVNGTASRNYAAAVDLASGTATAWNPNPMAAVDAITHAGSSVYLGGVFTSVGNWFSRPYAAAVDTATKHIVSWSPRFDGPIDVISVAGDTIYLGGSFTKATGAFGGVADAVTRNRAAAIDGPSGDLLAWSPDLNGRVRTIAVDGSSVYLGGNFTSAKAADRNRVAAVEATSGALLPWNPNVSAAVNSLSVAGLVAYVGGEFTTVNGAIPRAYAAAFDTGAGTAISWNPQPNDFVHALGIVGSTVYLGGAFTRLGTSTYRGRAAAVDVTAATPTPWDPGFNAAVRALVPSGANAYVAGDFTSLLAGQRRGRAAGVALSSGKALAFDPNLPAPAKAVAADCASGLIATGGEASTQLSFAQGLVTFFVDALGCTGARPHIDDRQLGDDVWRSSNTGSYDVAFTDAEGLAGYSVEVSSGPVRGGTRLQSWTNPSPLAGASVSTRWSLLPSTWRALREGPNYVSVRVVDTDGNTDERIDAFSVRKDTVAPSAVAPLTAVRTGTRVSLSWSASTDVTSGVAAYRVFAASTETGPWALLTSDGGTTATAFEDATILPGEARSYEVRALDLADNESTGNALASVSALAGTDGGPATDSDGGPATDGDGGSLDGGSLDAGGGPPLRRTVGCGCNCGATDSYASVFLLGVLLLVLRSSVVWGP